MEKNRFDSEQEANDYKLRHQLTQRVAEPISDGKWGLVFPIEAHVTVQDGAPDGVRTLGHPNVKHPYEVYCLEDAIGLANAKRTLNREPLVISLEQAREVVRSMLASRQHNWITGACALDVLDAAIDGRDLLTDNRLIAVESQVDQQEQPKG